VMVIKYSKKLVFPLTSQALYYAAATSSLEWYFQSKAERQRPQVLSFISLQIHYFIIFSSSFSSQLSCLTVFFSSALTLPHCLQNKLCRLAVREPSLSISLSFSLTHSLTFSLHHPSTSHTAICQRYKGSRRGHCKSFLKTWSLHIHHT